MIFIFHFSLSLLTTFYSPEGRVGGKILSELSRKQKKKKRNLETEGMNNEGKEEKKRKEGEEEATWGKGGGRSPWFPIVPTSNSSV